MTRGQSLVEILIGTALGALLVAAGIALIAPALQTSGQLTQIQTQAQLGQELADNVKAWAAGNWNGLFSLATTSANAYYLNTASSPFTVVASTSVVTSTYTAPATFGNSALGSGLDSNHDVIYFKASTTPALNGTLTSITWVGNACATGWPPTPTTCSSDHLGVALYTDNGGSPGTLIASSANDTSSASLLGSSGYTTSTVSITTPVTAGTQYWFAVYDATNPSQDIGYYFPDPSAANTFFYPAATQTSFPASAGAGSLYPEQPYIYATYSTTATTTSAVSSGYNIESVSVASTTYQRYFYVNDVYRDNNGNVTGTAGGNAYDPSVKQITVVVAAASSTQTSFISNMYLTRNANNVLNQTSWAGGSGQNNPVTFVGTTFALSSNISITATGSIQLANGGNTCTQ